jgi:hypothetical protein
MPHAPTDGRGETLLLLPAWTRFGRQSLDPELARIFGRGDPQPGDAGIEAQTRRWFALSPTHGAPAALTRQAEVGDAAGAAWLRVDPAHVRPDINGARLLGIGARLGLDQADVDALLPALKPVFGDSGFALDAPSPERWYLRLPREARLPAFSAPDDALGDDLFDHQPDGPEGRRWRALLNEVQIVLHNHPWNAERAARGLVPVNALWPWGGGVLPDRVVAAVAQVCSDDDVLQALALAAGARATSLPPVFAAEAALHDLRRTRDLAALQRDWLRPAVEALQQGAITALRLDFADGHGLRLTRPQRWRFWRGAWGPPQPTGEGA